GGGGGGEGAGGGGPREHTPVQPGQDQPRPQRRVGARGPLPGGDASREQAGELFEARGVGGLDLDGDGGLVGCERGGLHQYPAGLRVAGDVGGDGRRHRRQNGGRGAARGLGEPADSRVDAGGQAAVPLLVQRDEQGFLAGEVQVRGSLGHACRLGDVGHRGGVVAGPGKAFGRGGGDLVPARGARLIGDLGHRAFLPQYPAAGARRDRTFHGV